MSRLLIIITMVIIASGCASVSSPPQQANIPAWVSVPPSRLTELTPRDPKFMELPVSEISKLEINPNELLRCYDRENVEVLKAESRDKDIYILKANAELKTLRRLLKLTLDANL